MDDRRFSHVSGRPVTTRSRRQVLTGAARGPAGGIGALLLPRAEARSAGAQEASPYPRQDGDAPRIRRNVHGLDPAGPELAAYARGIAAMRAHPDTDPTSWAYQANRHGTIDPRALPGWATCEHFTHFFLSWHRMYLYRFERILGKAAGDPSFALPYWDYADPAQRALPTPFRRPAEPANPLFAAERDPDVNRGFERPLSAVDASVAFSFRDFSSATAPGLGFSAQLENTPHGDVHVLVGGGAAG